MFQKKINSVKTLVILILKPDIGFYRGELLCVYSSLISFI